MCMGVLLLHQGFSILKIKSLPNMSSLLFLLLKIRMIGFGHIQWISRGTQCYSFIWRVTFEQVTGILYFFQMVVGLPKFPAVISQEYTAIPDTETQVTRSHLH